MRIIFEFFSRAFYRHCFWAGAVVLLAVSAASAYAEEAQERHYLSDDVSEDLGKVRPLLDAKKWDEALAIIEKSAAKVKADSYDQAVLLNTKVQIYLSRNEFSKAIPCMEESLRLSQTHKYFEAKQEVELVFLLAQIYCTEANAPGRTPASQREYLDKTIQYMEKWDAISKKPTIDQVQFYGQVLFNIAQTCGDDSKRREEKLAFVRKAEAQASRALQLAIRPREPLFVLMVACAQEEQDFQKMSEYLELLVSQYPSNGLYWQQLLGTYVNLAGSAKKDELIQQYNVRAILTIERAQEVGQLSTPKDAYSLFSLYFNIQQYAKAAELMEAGLKNGTIEHEQRNYEMLSFCYQQTSRELKSIEVLKRAAARFPNAGQLYFQAANAYYALDKNAEALESAKLAVQKPGLEQAYKAYYFIAFLCYEMRKFDEGLVAIDKAISLLPPTANEPTYPKMREAILVGIEDQDRIRKAVELQRKQR